MTQKVSILLVDDIDGSEAHDTIQFGVDGARYEIDLSLQNADELRSKLASYIEKARKVGNSGGQTTRPGKTVVNGTSNKEVREWAKAQGLKVNDRGRIPADVIARYKAVNSR